MCAFKSWLAFGDLDLIFKVAGGFKCWLAFGDLDLIFKVAGGFKCVKLWLKMRYLLSYWFINARIAEIYFLDNPKSVLYFGDLELIKFKS